MLNHGSPTLPKPTQTNPAPMKKLWLQLSKCDKKGHAYFDCLQESIHASFGIMSCQINTRKKQVLVCFDPFTANLDHVRKIIEDAGFTAEPIIQ
ncbi:MAG: heavy-metal-associated domain-containing protein [Cyanobacteria bacterium J06627_8]